MASSSASSPHPGAMAERPSYCARQELSLPGVGESAYGDGVPERSLRVVRLVELTHEGEGIACHHDQLGIQPGDVTPDGLFSLESVNCLGACALGPIVSENGTYHHHMTPGKLRKLIEALRDRETGDNGNA